MFPPFPQELARHYCLSLIEQIEKGSVFLQQVATESLERKGQGLMLGCLVGWDKERLERVIVYAVSGNAKKLVFLKNPGKLFDEKNVFEAPSIVSAEEITSALNKNDLEIHNLTDLIKSKKGTLKSDDFEALVQKRKVLTDQSLASVFNLYSFTAFNGKKVSLNQIIQKHYGKLPPAGTGDCCAPKLLDFAFSHNPQIISMDEVYFGPDTKNKSGGQSYPPCDSRCGYILPYILGFEILYRDNEIIVVNKESGLLSVSGRGPEKEDCLEKRVKAIFPDCISQCAAHRLDMETSGILILARNKNALKNLQMQFATSGVKKKYVALLDGILRGKPEGHIELKFRLDLENRPYQIYDEINGKLEITDWKKIGVEKWKNPVTGEVRDVTRIEFFPKTGRTHQLRLAASHKNGLGLAILGDSLYGKWEKGQRLMLHACEIEFKHPSSGEIMHFYCPGDF